MTLQEFFGVYPEAAVAFSGGVDSAFLLYAAHKYAANIQAYYVKSEFQPAFELADAVRLAERIGVRIKILRQEVLTDPVVRENPPDRCYYCKKAMFCVIAQAAAADGFALLLDGTNASDEAGDRPGMRALQEQEVRSPLRECGLTKDRIRELSREAGLFTWDKPVYACLATRVPAGEALTQQKLYAVEQSEDYLFSLGFRDFRVRSQDGHARLQMPEGQMGLVLRHRKEIRNKLGQFYTTVSLDLEERG